MVPVRSSQSPSQAAIIAPIAVNKKRARSAKIFSRFLSESASPSFNANRRRHQRVISLPAAAVLWPVETSRYIQFTLRRIGRAICDASGATITSREIYGPNGQRGRVVVYPRTIFGETCAGDRCTSWISRKENPWRAREPATENLRRQIGRKIS